MPIKHQRDYYASLGDGLERSDCAVRAISIAACISYEAAHALLEKHGRQRGKPTKWTVIRKAMEDLFPEVWFKSFASTKPLTLVRICELYPKGNFVLFTTRHAFALCDGVVHDWQSHPLCRVIGFYKLCD